MMRWTANCYLTVFALMLASACDIAVAADGGIDAMRLRQKKVRSLSVEFKMKEFRAKGSLTINLGIKTGGDSPPEDTLSESRNTLLIDGNMIRYEGDRPIWHMQERKFFRDPLVTVTNGKLSKGFYPQGLGPAGTLEGVIGQTAHSLSAKQFFLTPITMNYRGLDPSIAPYPFTAAKSTGHSLPIDGVPCVEYQVPLSSSLTVSLWLDPAKDFVVRRIRKTRLARIVEQQDIRFGEHPSGGEVPMSWVRTEYDAAGKIVSSTEVEVVEFQINPTIPASRFELEFPPGAFVHDQRNSKDYRIQSDGSMREVTPLGDDLPEVISQPGTSWFRRNMWSVIGLVAATLILTVLFRRRAVDIFRRGR